ncbi:MAG: hypothetical protein JWO72_1122 [Caulobacteraceae bacterium]|nr:hypothetical protein [Caulobacteraceae bacterium]
MGAKPAKPDDRNDARAAAASDPLGGWVEALYCRGRWFGGVGAGPAQGPQPKAAK